MNRLRSAAAEFGVSLLNYNVTRNHVHLLVNAPSTEPVSRLMRAAAGELAQAFNRRKGRSGAFWEGRFHSTMIQEGLHLWNCLKYIDLNMVRARVVPHPRDWAWTGYRELMGERQRYRLIDMARLLELLGCGDAQAFRQNYQHSIMESIAQDQLKRDPKWTEAVAIGSQTYIERIKADVSHRQTWASTQEQGSESTWILRESVGA